jgi:hypothetical protein
MVALRIYGKSTELGATMISYETLRVWSGRSFECVHVTTTGVWGINLYFIYFLAGERDGGLTNFLCCFG